MRRTLPVMDGPQRIKLALDEARMLVLGAQVLLGFQLSGAFQERFAALPMPARWLHAASLMLMVLVIGLLVSPAIHHRVAGRACATEAIYRTIGGFMVAALLPFALSLGISIAIAALPMGGEALAIPAGAAVIGLGLWLWFGMGLRARQRREGRSLKMKDEHVPLAKRIDQMLTEARVILPGAQALLGFQLTVVLTAAFESLPAASKMIHGLALASIAVCTMLLIAPAAYHRMVFAGEAVREFYDLGSRFITAATFALAIGLAADVYVVIAKIADSSGVGLAAAAAALAMLVGLWHVSPHLKGASRSRARTPLHAKRL